MNSKNIFCIVCTMLQKPPEIHAPRLEYLLKERFYRIETSTIFRRFKECLEFDRYENNLC